MIKEIFTWWNKQTFGTRLNTILFGKLVGEDNSGNKYYESKSGKDGLFTMGKSKHQKYPVNGILGFTELEIKLKTVMN